MEIGDTHAHLFNAADLPVVGFLHNVLLPTYLSAWEALWPSIESCCAAIKTLALPADEERRRLKQPSSPFAVDEVSPQRFSRLVAGDINPRVAARGNAPLLLKGRSTSLEDSYALLALLLAEADANQRGSASGSSRVQRVPKVRRGFIEQLALSGSNAAVPVGSSELLPGFLPSAEALRQLPSLWDGVKFIYALIQPRCSHVGQYLRSMSSSETRTVRVVNLLVDYDQWVGDGSAEGSGIVEQLKFWTEYRGHALGRVAIETLAPYDPLRHAEDRLTSGNDDGYFGQIKSWADGTSDGIRIAGFKLYPPMGFKAKGNTKEPPTDRAGEVIRKRWNEKKWPLDRFAPEVETSLDRFFEFCAAKRIPILAHARNSNEAWLGAGEMANPTYWLERVKTAPAPLKICLAHFTAKTPPKPWGMEVYKSVLEHNKPGRSEIYFDLAFADELLDGNAKGIMEQVAELCGQADPDCRWFLFGTDWIMLAQLHKVEEYIPQLLKAARQIPFWRDHPTALDNLLRNNLARYLLK